MTRSGATWMSALLLAALCGCGGRGNVDLLEARLREREDDLYRTQSALQSKRNELAAARRQNDALRSQLAGTSESPLLPEQADRLSRVEGIRINKLLTGGLDRDGRPGDEMLAALVAPHDADGETVKFPGRIEMQLFDLASASDPRPIGSWEFDAEQSREQWHSGFLASGFLFRLPLERVPKDAQALLRVKYSTADGRTFDAHQTIRITPGAAVARTEPLSAPDPTELVPVPPGDAEAPFYERTSHERTDREPAGPERGSAGVPDLRTEWYDEELDTPATPETRRTGRVLGVRSPLGLEIDGVDARPLDLPETSAESTVPLRTSDRFTSDEIPQFR